LLCSLLSSLWLLTIFTNSFRATPILTGIRNSFLSEDTNRNISQFSSDLRMTAETNLPQTNIFPAGKKRPLRPIDDMIQDRELPTDNHTRKAALGDIVTIEFELKPENGYVSENLFDSAGEISFVLGWGNYLPGLHELLLGGMSVGDTVQNLSIDAGFGSHSPEMVIEVPKSNLKKVQKIEKIVPNSTLNLQGGIQVTVVDVTKDTITVDANHPLAGSSFSCNLRVLDILPYPVDKLVYKDHCENEQSSSSLPPSPFEVATFAMGCFWGVELAFMRTPGVVGTRAGYTQGTVDNPSYEEIKEGHTGYREAVMVIYDSRVVSYQDVLAIYNERLAVTAPEYFKLDIFAEDDDDSESSPDSQYRHGIYFHNEDQRKMAHAYISSVKDSRYCEIELKPATLFYSADVKHQQYLYKGGQAARKGCRETIRCYG